MVTFKEEKQPEILPAAVNSRECFSFTWALVYLLKRDIVWLKREVEANRLCFSFRKGLPSLSDERPQFRLGSEPKEEKEAEKEKENKQVHNA